MASRLPKRMKDLPPLEPDSEDDLETPAKSKSPDLGENKDLDIFGNSLIPKRISELSPLQSDSDEEDLKIDRLNCAILNESFILSPSKSLECDTPNWKHEKSRLSVTNRDLAARKIDKNDSFEKDFKKFTVDEKENGMYMSQPLCSTTTQSKTRQALFPAASSTALKDNSEFPKHNLLLFSQTKRLQVLNSEKSVQSNSITEETLDRAKSPTENIRSVRSSNYILTRTRNLYDRKKSPLNTIVPKVNELVDDEMKKSPASTTTDQPTDLLESMDASKDLHTPFKSSEHNFVTPQVKTYQMPVSRRPNPLLFGSTQKSRSVIENEFRSQKILFRTPIVMSRPIVNSSINLSLDDTVKESAVAPPTFAEQKLSPVKEISAKRSSEDLFNNVVPASSKETQVKSKKVVLINGNEYVIQRKLGSGGSSSVFLAHRKDKQCDCALKIVDLRGDKSVVDGYLNETKLLAKLQGNINVVSLYEYEHLSKEFTLYMVMEKGDSDLNKILQSYKTDLPLFTLTSFWYQMLQSVNYIHENGVIHSDLKPANFLMVKGRLKLIDFGIASNISIDSTSIIKSLQAGTINYISPEALTDTSTGNSPAGKNQPKIKISTKSDVWSLGCILYLLLYKKTPFGHIKNVYAKGNAISSPTTEIDYPQLSNYYPPILVEMAKKCLQHNQKKRTSVADLLKYPFNMLIPIDSEHFVCELKHK